MPSREIVWAISPATTEAAVLRLSLDSVAVSIDAPLKLRYGIIVERGERSRLPAGRDVSLDLDGQQGYVVVGLVRAKGAHETAGEIGEGKVAHCLDRGQEPRPRLRPCPH